MIGPDPHTTLQTFAFFHQRCHGIQQITTLRKIIFFRFVHVFFKIFASIGKVTRVDTDLFHSIGHEQCYNWLEMHVRTQWNVVSFLEQTFTNLGGSVRFTFSLDGNTDQIKSLIGTPHNLFNSCIHIGCIGSSHGLTNDRMIRSKIDRTACDGPRLASDHLVQIFAILANRTVHAFTFSGIDRRGPKNVLDRCYLSVRACVRKKRERINHEP